MGIGMGVGMGRDESKTWFPYSPANDMLWLVYFLGHYFLLNGGGIVHLATEIEIRPISGLRASREVGKWCTRPIQEKGALRRV